MRSLEVRLDQGDAELVVGTLAERERRVYFEYDPAFLAAPLPLSPFKLPVRPGLFEHAERDFAEVFGVFNDSLPDGWGLLLMDRECRRRGVDPARLTVLDRLAYIGTRGMGALTYHPATATVDEETLWSDLQDLARQAERIQEGSAEDVLPALRIAGGSPGGARPKVVVAVREDGHVLPGTAGLPDGYRHYLIKFPSREDGPGAGAVEEAYAQMAREAGLDVPRTRLFETRDGGRYFGAERFDRAGDRRLHMHTLSGLLHASHRVPSLDYEGLLRATLALTRDHRQVEEAFRRMVFNVLAHNRDDHVKNFSYLMDSSGAWRLAPAYDLTCSDGPGGEHTMDVAGEAASPRESDMLRVSNACGMDAGRAQEIVEQVRAAVDQWSRFARSTGTPRDIERLVGKAIAAALARR